MRTERSGRLRETGSNALASSIVLVCRPRIQSAPMATRSEFLRALKRELPDALRTLQKEAIAPADLEQAAIGPGMAVFSRYSRVLEANGDPMSVRTALELINGVLDEVRNEQEAEYDAETRWAIVWFSQYGMSEGPFADAETYFKAKNTSIYGLLQSGIAASARGKVRLLRRDELPPDWHPGTDDRRTVWEMTQYLIHRLLEGGEGAAAELVRVAPDLAETAHLLAYRLYDVCNRKGWADEGLAYNSLGTSWSEITRLAAERPAGQIGMFGE